jgi:hypothetical protein
MDPGFSNTGEPGRVANLIGPGGAWIADLFLLLFGAPAFLFPMMLGVTGWLLFRPPAGERPSRASLAFRLSGFDPERVSSFEGREDTRLANHNPAAMRAFLADVARFDVDATTTSAAASLHFDDNALLLFDALASLTYGEIIIECEAQSRG